jgi:hypothetical protein
MISYKTSGGGKCMKISINSETISECFAVIFTAVVTFVAYKAAYWHVERAEGAMIGIAIMFTLLACLGQYALHLQAVRRLLLRQHPFVSLVTASLNALTANILFQGGLTVLAAMWCVFVASDIITSVFVHRAHAGLLGDLSADPDEDEI